MSEDPKLFDAGDYNLFRYCHNDPVDNVDPMGLGWLNSGIATPERLEYLERLKEQAEMLGYGAIQIGTLNYAIGQMQQALGGVTGQGYHPVNFNMSMGLDPHQNWNRDIHATAFSGGNDPTDNTNPAFLNRKLGANEPGVALPGGNELRGKSIDIVYPRTGTRQNAIPVVDKGPHYNDTQHYPADRYWNTGARPLAESRFPNKAGLDLSPYVWRSFGFGIRYDRYGVPYPTSRYDADPVFDWRFH